LGAATIVALLLPQRLLIYEYLPRNVASQVAKKDLYQPKGLILLLTQLKNSFKVTCKQLSKTI